LLPGFDVLKTLSHILHQLVTGFLETLSAIQCIASFALYNSKSSKSREKVDLRASDLHHTQPIRWVLAREQSTEVASVLRSRATGPLTDIGI
jgi:hypothetical protein